MNTNRDRLDDAIDVVSARLTRVDDNDALAAQIINALPERVTVFGWLVHSWAPRLAMIALVAAAGIVWGNRREASAPTASPLASSQPINTPTALMTSASEAEPNRTMPLEHRERVLSEEAMAHADHDYSLAAIAGPDALGVGSLGPDDLPVEDALAIAPLAIADLPLTAESFSQR